MVNKNNKYRLLIYLALSMTLTLFVVSALFDFLSAIIVYFQVGIFDYAFSLSRLFLYVKIALVGFGVGVAIWFFWCRKI